MHAYQIAIIANGSEAKAVRLQEVLQSRLDDLGVLPNAVQFLDEDTLAARDRKSPIVCAYFSERKDRPVDPALRELHEIGSLILPLVPTLEHFIEKVPAELAGINGFVWDGAAAAEEAAAAVLLEGLALLRRSRRLFISYLRRETSSVAIRLFEFLEEHGFDVFLDTHSVRPGEMFQEILWHRLSDTDVVIALDSPQFDTSRWTMEELVKANLTHILVLQVLWPGKTLDKFSALNAQYALTSNSFEDSHSLTGKNAFLSEGTEMELLRNVESLRARAMAARHSYLVEEFTAATRLAGYKPEVQPERFITVERSDGSFLAAVPTVGVPDAFRYQEIEELIDAHPRKHNELVLLFDDRGILKRWLKHLGWLDSQKLKVRSTSIAKLSSLIGAK
jgi:hypothetical protein